MASRALSIDRQRKATRRIAAALGVTFPHTRGDNEYRAAVQLERIADLLEGRKAEAQGETDHAPGPEQPH
jgi:hypothetical protein